MSGSEKKIIDILVIKSPKNLSKDPPWHDLLAGFELAERILVAYESKAQEDEHSCFSDTTHNDSIYDIVGIKNVWTGKYHAEDQSLRVQEYEICT